jgi:Mn2+/Fe2+ NRAMP family transporter
MILINKKKIMGIYTNKSGANIIGWSTVVIMVILSAALLVMPLFNR